MKNQKPSTPNRSFSKLWKAFLKTLTPVARFCYLSDLPFPFSKQILSSLDESELSRIRREKLAFDVQVSELRLGFGPLWLRQSIEQLRETYSRWRFILHLSTKVALSAAILGIPVSLFIVFRLFLPYPEQLQLQLRNGVTNGQEGHWRLIPSAYLPTDSHDVEAVATPDFQIDVLSSNRLHPGRHEAFVHLFQHKEMSVSARRAHLASPAHTLQLSLQEEPQTQISGGLIIQGEFALLSRSGKPVRCRVELTGPQGEVYFSSEAESHAATASGTQVLQDLGRFLTMSTALLNTSPAWERFQFRVNLAPRTLQLRISETGSQNSTDLQSDCLCAFTGPELLVQTVNPPKLKSQLIVVLDGVSELAARHPSTMPKLLNLGHHGVRHPALILPSSDAASNFDLFFNEQELFAAAQKNGLHTAFYGDTSDLNFAPDNLPLELISNQDEGYRGLLAARDFKRWLDVNAETPYFAVLRLSDAGHRHIPPWKLLDIRKFVVAPFGYNARTQRYKAMLRYTDLILSLIVDLVQNSAAGQSPELTIIGLRGLQYRSLPQASRPSHSDAPTLRASFKPSGSYLPDLLHVPWVETQLQADESSFKTQKDPEGTAHFLASPSTVAMRLRKRFSGKGSLEDPPDNLFELSLGTPVEPNIGRVFTSPDVPESRLTFELNGPHVLPELVYMQEFPYRTTLPKRDIKLVLELDILSGERKVILP